MKEQRAAELVQPAVSAGNISPRTRRNMSESNVIMLEQVPVDGGSPRTRRNMSEIGPSKAFPFPARPSSQPPRQTKTAWYRSLLRREGEEQIKDNTSSTEDADSRDSSPRPPLGVRPVILNSTGELSIPFSTLAPRSTSDSAVFITPESQVPRKTPPPLPAHYTRPSIAAPKEEVAANDDINNDYSRTIADSEAAVVSRSPPPLPKNRLLPAEKLIRDIGTEYLNNRDANAPTQVERSEDTVPRLPRILSADKRAESAVSTNEGTTSSSSMMSEALPETRSRSSHQSSRSTLSLEVQPSTTEGKDAESTLDNVNTASASASAKTSLKKERPRSPPPPSRNRIGSETVVTTSLQGEILASNEQTPRSPTVGIRVASPPPRNRITSETIPTTTSTIENKDQNSSSDTSKKLSLKASSSNNSNNNNNSGEVSNAVRNEANPKLSLKGSTNNNTNGETSGVVRSTPPLSRSRLGSETVITTSAFHDDESENKKMSEDSRKLSTTPIAKRDENNNNNNYSNVTDSSGSISPASTSINLPRPPTTAKNSTLNPKEDNFATFTSASDVVLSSPIVQPRPPTSKKEREELYVDVSATPPRPPTSAKGERRGEEYSVCSPSASSASSAPSSSPTSSSSAASAASMTAASSASSCCSSMSSSESFSNPLNRVTSPDLSNLVSIPPPRLPPVSKTPKENNNSNNNNNNSNSNSNNNNTSNSNVNIKREDSMASFSSSASTSQIISLSDIPRASSPPPTRTTPAARHRKGKSSFNKDDLSSALLAASPTLNLRFAQSSEIDRLVESEDLFDELADKEEFKESGPLTNKHGVTVLTGKALKMLGVSVPSGKLPTYCKYGRHGLQEATLTVAKTKLHTLRQGTVSSLVHYSNRSANLFNEYDFDGEEYHILSLFRQGEFGRTAGCAAALLLCSDDQFSKLIPVIACAIAETPGWAEQVSSALIDTIKKRVAQSQVASTAVHFLKMSQLLSYEWAYNGWLEGVETESYLFELLTLLATKEAGFSVSVAASREALHPFQSGFSISGFTVSKVFNSNARPRLIVPTGKHEGDNEIKTGSPIIIKQGDDLRQDVACLHMMCLMNSLWEDAGLTHEEMAVKSLAYGCLAVTPNLGCIQFIPNSVPLKMVKDAGRYSSSAITRMITTGAGSFIAAYILGVRDRHHDNILICKADGSLFHIDFGHILGDETTIDTGAFAVTPDLKEVMTSLDANMWELFVKLCVTAYKIIRDHSRLIISFATMLMAPFQSQESVRRFIADRLKLNLDEIAALGKLRDKIQSAPTRLKTKFKNVVHGIATGD